LSNSKMALRNFSCMSHTLRSRRQPQGLPARGWRDDPQERRPFCETVSSALGTTDGPGAVHLPRPLRGAWSAMVRRGRSRPGVVRVLGSRPRRAMAGLCTRSEIMPPARWWW